MKVAIPDILGQIRELVVSQYICDLINAWK